MTASVAVSADADLVAIATAAGNPAFEARRYADGLLYVEGVTQAALDAALADAGGPPVAPVPESLTPLQVRLALLAAGLLDDFEAVKATAPREMQLAADFATVVYRTDPMLLAFATQLGLTEQQVDDLFRAAAAAG